MKLITITLLTSLLLAISAGGGICAKNKPGKAGNPARPPAEKSAEGPKAKDPVKEGLRIFAEAYDRDAGYGDLKADLTMLLKEKTGSPVTRLMEIAILELKKEGTRTLVTFNNPLDVRDTKVLTHSRSAGDDEQWIYLPAFKRVKQISDSNKTSSFMGSEFTYEDINSINIQVPKFSYKYLRTENIGEFPCFVVERSPRYGNSGYTRQVVWLDKTSYVIVKIEFYDSGKALLKTLSIKGYRKYLEKFWRPKEMVMVNHQKDKTTVLTWTGYKFRNGLGQNDFDLSVLKR